MLHIGIWTQRFWAENIPFRRARLCAIIERVKMQKSRGRQPETFLHFYSREIPQNYYQRIWSWSTASSWRRGQVQTNVQCHVPTTTPISDVLDVSYSEIGTQKTLIQSQCLNIIVACSLIMQIPNLCSVCCKNTKREDPIAIVPMSKCSVLISFARRALDGSPSFDFELFVCVIFHWFNSNSKWLCSQHGLSRNTNNNVNPTLNISS